jgi:hypothetical protein
MIYLYRFFHTCSWLKEGKYLLLPL